MRWYWFPHSCCYCDGTLSAGVQLTALSFWFASFSLMMVTYDAMMFHSLLTVAALNVVDVMIPFFFGITEFSLFPLLAPVTVAGNPSQSTAGALTHLSWWPLGLATMALVGSLYMLNAQTSLSKTLEALPDHLRPYLLQCKSVMRKDQFGLAGSAAFNLIAFLLLRYGFPELKFLGWLPSGAELRPWEGVLGIIVIANSCQSLFTFERLRRDLADALNRPVAAED